MAKPLIPPGAGYERLHASCGEFCTGCGFPFDTDEPDALGHRDTPGIFCSAFCHREYTRRQSAGQVKREVR